MLLNFAEDPRWTVEDLDKGASVTRGSEKRFGMVSVWEVEERQKLQGRLEAEIRAREEDSKSARVSVALVKGESYSDLLASLDGRFDSHYTWREPWLWAFTVCTAHLFKGG